MSQAMSSQQMEMKPLGQGLVNRFAAWVDRWVNPIVVKELRQAVRSRFIMAAINLMLFIELCIALAFMFGAATGSYSLGRELFMTLHGFLLAVCIFFVPAYVGVRFTAERSGQSMDLMFTTTLSSFSIVWGKFLCGVVLTLVMFSTAAPFMVLTYMLRGIDVPTVLLVVFIDFLAVTAMVQVVILLTSGGTNLLVRLAMVAVCLGLCGMMFAMVMGFTVNELVGFGGGIDWSEIWLVLILLVVCAVLAHVFVMCCSAAVLSAPMSNRAFRVRVAFVAMWLLSGLGFLIIGGLMGDEGGIVVWAGSMLTVLTLALAVAVSERDRWGPRVLMQVPRDPLRRFLAFFFYSGSAGGFLFCLVLIAATLVVLFGTMAFINPMGIGNFWEGVMSMTSIMLYIVAYALSAVFIVRYIFKGLHHTATGAVALFLMAMGMIVPVIVQFMLSLSHNWDQGYIWRIGNPFAATMGRDHEAFIFLVVSSIWAGVMFVLCLPWMRGQWAAFKRVEPAAAGAGSDGVQQAGAAETARPAAVATAVVDGVEVVAGDVRDADGVGGAGDVQTKVDV